MRGDFTKSSQGEASARPVLAKTLFLELCHVGRRFSVLCYEQGKIGKSRVATTPLFGLT